jgi:hypothetical protein
VYFDISRSEAGYTDILIEKESSCHFWQGSVTSEFIAKINKKFDMEYTQFVLFTRMAKAMISGDANIVFDWLTTGELTSMIQQTGKQVNSPANLQDRVLIMIESVSGKQVNIPISLMAYEDRNQDRFYQVVKRLKQRGAGGSNTRRAEGLFLTGADVVQNEELEMIKEENKRLNREIEKVKAEKKRNEERENFGNSETDSRALRSQLTDLKVELSALPVLKNQLKDKVKELEIMNMYIREVEICTKIRAPIPNLNSYKNSLMGNSGDNNGQETYTSYKNRPAVTTNARGRNLNLANGTRNVPGTAPAKRSMERKTFLPSRDLSGVYRTNTSGGPPSRNPSNSI